MPSRWLDDEDLFRRIRESLFSAVVGDVMDRLGLEHQFLPPRIRPIVPEMLVVGRAMPVLVEDVPDGVRPDPPFGLMLDALDDLRSGEVYVCGGGSPTYALWGELMSTRARLLGAAGAVADGYYRDSGGIVRLGFPTFGHGAYAQDQGPRGRVVDFRSPLRIGQTLIEPGDIVLGDRDGVCIVPRKHEEDVFVGAWDKANRERLVRHAIENGMSSREAFAEYGVL